MLRERSWRRSGPHVGGPVSSPQKPFGASRSSRPGCPKARNSPLVDVPTLPSPSSPAVASLGSRH